MKLFWTKNKILAKIRCGCRFLYSNNLRKKSLQKIYFWCFSNTTSVRLLYVTGVKLIWHLVFPCSSCIWGKSLHIASVLTKLWNGGHIPPVALLDIPPRELRQFLRCSALSQDSQLYWSITLHCFALPSHAIIVAVGLNFWLLNEPLIFVWWMT